MGPMKHIIAALMASALFGCASPEPPKNNFRFAYLEAHPELDQDIKFQILQGYIRKGMTKEQVRAAWGEPHHVNRYAAGRREQWVYGYREFGKSFTPNQFVYFDKGIVDSWQSIGS